MTRSSSLHVESFNGLTEVLSFDESCEILIYKDGSQICDRLNTLVLKQFIYFIYS